MLGEENLKINKRIFYSAQQKMYLFENNTLSWIIWTVWKAHKIFRYFSYSIF